LDALSKGLCDGPGWQHGTQQVGSGSTAAPTEEDFQSGQDCRTASAEHKEDTRSVGVGLGTVVKTLAERSKSTTYENDGLTTKLRDSADRERKE